VSFSVKLSARAAVHVVVATAGGKALSEFTLTGQKGLNKLSTFVRGAANNKLRLKVTVLVKGQKHTIVERIRKVARH